MNYFCEIDGLILYGEENFSQYFSNYTLYQSKHLKKLFGPPESTTKSIESPEDDTALKSSDFDILPVSLIFF